MYNLIKNFIALNPHQIDCIFNNCNIKKGHSIKDVDFNIQKSWMGWLNVQYHFYTCAFRYLNRLLKMHQDHLTKRVVEYQLINFNEHSWCGDLCNMLKELRKVGYIIDGKLLNLENIKEDLID